MADSIADIKTQHIRSNILYCNNAINIVIESVLVSLNKYSIKESYHSHAEGSCYDYYDWFPSVGNLKIE